jgi:hypothetical protein
LGSDHVAPELLERELELELLGRLLERAASGVSHLHSAYRKLHIRARGELSAALAMQDQ